MRPRLSMRHAQVVDRIGNFTAEGQRPLIRVDPFVEQFAAAERVSKIEKGLGKIGTQFDRISRRGDCAGKIVEMEQDFGQIAMVFRDGGIERNRPPDKIRGLRPAPQLEHRQPQKKQALVVLGLKIQAR